MPKHNPTRNGLNTATLTPKALEQLLIGFAPQQRRVVRGVHDNQGVLTHDAFSLCYANNISHVARKVNTRLMNKGLILFCVEQAAPSPLTKSSRWYLCHLKLETFDIATAAANDGGLL